MLNLLYILLGIGLLSAGGEALIRGALAAAHRLGVSPLLSGLLIVGFGTSVPELVVSVDAVLSDSPDIAVGNVVGSNIGNVLLILGLCALIAPLAVRPQALRRDGVMAVVASVMFVVLAWDGAIVRAESWVLLAALAAYLGWAYVTERRAGPAQALSVAESEEVTPLPDRPGVIVLAVIAGLALLIGGSQVLLKGAVATAQAWGVSEAAIGLTLVAVGTSLPELTISVMAALRRHADVAVGNVLGSNIFNLLGILGVSALVQPLAVNERIGLFDQWVLLFSAALVWVFLYTGQRLARSEAALLLSGYAGYVLLSFALF